MKPAPRTLALGLVALSAAVALWLMLPAPPAPPSGPRTGEFIPSDPFDPPFVPPSGFTPPNWYVGGGDAATTTTTTQTVTVTPSVTNILNQGPNYTYTVAYTNTGSHPAISVSVATTLDAALTYVSATGTGWTIGHTGNVVTATMASAAIGAANPITITVAPGSSATASSPATAVASNAATANGASSVNVLACTKDATSGKYWPSTATEWANAFTVAGIGSGGPSHLYNLQDASGSPVDAIGSANLTVAGSPGYQAAVTGWTRKAITAADAGTVKLFSTALPDPASNSYLVIGLGYIPSNPASVRNVLGIGSTTFNGLCVTTAGKVETKSGASNATGSTAISDGVVRLLAYRYNHTASTSVSFTDSEKVTAPVFNAASGNTFYTFSNGTSAAEGWLGIAVLTGANAEITDAQLKALEQVLGASPGWT